MRPPTDPRGIGTCGRPHRIKITSRNMIKDTKAKRRAEDSTPYLEYASALHLLRSNPACIPTCDLI
jgi:hypothetical protein